MHVNFAIVLAFILCEFVFVKKIDVESASHSLTDFAEGFIGKMKVRRSGKVELELSNVVFEGSALPSKILQVRFI